MKAWKLALVMTVSLSLCAGIAYAQTPRTTVAKNTRSQGAAHSKNASWQFVGKTKDGNSWYFDSKSLKVVNYTGSYNYHINAAIKIVPSGESNAAMAKKYGQPVASVIERWRLHGREGFWEVVDRKVFNGSGKVIHTDNEKQCEKDGGEWEDGSIQSAIFDKIWERVN